MDPKQTITDLFGPRLAFGGKREFAHSGHSLGEQDIDDRILHCLSIKKRKIAQPG